MFAKTSVCLSEHAAMAYFYSPEIANAMDEERILNVTSRGSGKTSVVTPLPVVAFTCNAVVTFSMLIVFSPQSPVAAVSVRAVPGK